MGFSPTALRGPVEASVNPVGVGTPLSAEHCCDDIPLVMHPLHRSKPFWPPYFRVLALTFASLAVLYWVLRCFDRLRSGRKSAGTSRALADVNETPCLSDHGTDTDKEGGESEDGGFPGPSREAPHTLLSELPAAQGMETAAANEASAHLLEEWSGADGDVFWQWYPETAGGASAAEPSLQWMQHPQELQLDPLHVGDIYFPPRDLHQSVYEPPGLSAHPFSQESATQVPYMSMAPYTDTSYPYSQELSDQEAVLLPVAYPEGAWHQTPHNPMESAQLQFSQGGLRTHPGGTVTDSGEQHSGESAAGGLTQSQKVQSLSPSSQNPFGGWYSGPAGDASAAEPSLQWMQPPQELQLDPLHVGDIYFPPGDLHPNMYEPPGLSAHPFSQESATQVPYMPMAPYTSYPYSQDLSDQEAVLLHVAYSEGPSTDQGARLALITLKILTMDLGVLSLLPEDLEPVRQSIGDTLLELVESTTSYKGKGQEENYNIKEVSRMSPLIRQIMLPRHEDREVSAQKRRARTLTMMGWVRHINQHLARMLWDLPVFAESTSREDFEKLVEQDIKVLNAIWRVHKKYVNRDRLHRRHVLASQTNSKKWLLLSYEELQAEDTTIFPSFEKIIEEFEQTVNNAGGIPRIAASVSETSGDGANTAKNSVVEWPFIPLTSADRVDPQGWLGVVSVYGRG
ncbi:hypothetical protein EMWEY_00057960, partial [Eimeria maxima]